jgi:YggT family protein
MFILGNFIKAIAVIVEFLLTALNWLIIIRAFISWVSPDPLNPIVQFLYKTTEPILQPFRRIIPMYNVGIDFSPLLALLVIWFLKIFLVSTLYGAAARLG